MKTTNYTITLGILFVMQWFFMIASIYVFTESDSFMDYGLFSFLLFLSINCYGLARFYKRELLRDFERTMGVSEDTWKAMSRFQRRKFTQGVKSGKIKAV